MNAERQALARAALETEAAKKEFDTLCAMHPEAVVFWDDEGHSAELEIAGATIRIS